MDFFLNTFQVVEEKRRLFTRMSKFSLQQEEKDSFLAHQREVDERRILEASHTLASSPLRQQAGAAAGSAGESRVDPYSVAPAAITHLMGDRGSVPHAPNVPVASSAVPVGNYLSSGHTTSATAASVAPTVPRPTSPYLREVLQQPTRTASARTSTESNNVESLNSPSHLKAELSQLDVEIGECSSYFFTHLYAYGIVSDLCFQHTFRTIERETRQSSNAALSAHPE